jgi:hypothetical protein
VHQSPIEVRDGVSRAYAALSSSWVQVAVGVALGVAVTGPAWTGDALLNLDLAVFDRVPNSPGFWGIGPELPRRAPVITVLAFVTNVVGGGVQLTAAFMTMCIAVAFVGAVRLARRASLAAALASATLYALSPWMITRLSVGHLGLALVAALLPWVLPILLQPTLSLRRTFIAALALAMAGYAGGTIGAMVVLAGVVGVGWVAALRVIGAWAVAQLPWVAPGLAVAWSSTSVSGGGSFRTDISGPGDFGRLALGYGFWQRGNDLAFESAVVPLVAVAIVGLAAFGAPRLPTGWGRRATALAAVAFMVAAVQELPLLGDVYRNLSNTLPGAVFRESQRMLVLFLVWLAPAVALGLTRLGSVRPSGARIGAVGVAAIACSLAVPAMWGVDGRLRAVDLDVAWTQVRDTVERSPGTVLAVPWNQYIDVAAAGGRRVYHPAATLVRGDVLNASDPEFGDDRRETSDPREPFVDRAVARFNDGTAIAPSLAELGVRWIIVVSGAEDERWESLVEDPGLELVVAGSDIRLYGVKDWPGQAVTAEGDQVTTRRWIEPMVRFESTAAQWFAPHMRGWVSGSTDVDASATGTIRLPSGARSVWFWPALAVIAAYAATAAAASIALWGPARAGWARRRNTCVTDEPCYAQPPDPGEDVS